MPRRPERNTCRGGPGRRVAAHSSSMEETMRPTTATCDNVFDFQALLHPGTVFEHPKDVVARPSLTLGEPGASRLRRHGRRKVQAPGAPHAGVAERFTPEAPSDPGNPFRIDRYASPEPARNAGSLGGLY